MSQYNRRIAWRGVLCLFGCKTELHGLILVNSCAQLPSSERKVVDLSDRKARCEAKAIWVSLYKNLITHRATFRQAELMPQPWFSLVDMEDTVSSQPRTWISFLQKGKVLAELCIWIGELAVLPGLLLWIQPEFTPRDLSKHFISIMNIQGALSDCYMLH